MGIRTNIHSFLSILPTIGAILLTSKLSRRLHGARGVGPQLFAQWAQCGKSCSAKSFERPGQPEDAQVNLCRYPRFDMGPRTRRSRWGIVGCEGKEKRSEKKGKRGQKGEKGSKGLSQAADNVILRRWPVNFGLLPVDLRIVRVPDEALGRQRDMRPRKAGPVLALLGQASAHGAPLDIPADSA